MSFIIGLVLFSCNENVQDQKRIIKIMRYENGLVKEVHQMVDNKKDGKVIGFSKDGRKIYEINYEKDLKNGVSIGYLDGKEFYQEQYKDGKLHGWSKYYNTSCDIIKEEGEYRNGMKDGVWFEYYGTELSVISIYSNDTLLEEIYSKFDQEAQTSPYLPPIECD